ncbi:SpaH/EbpB family LPXTG-anchored major pilin [Clostridium sp. YIM B02505]|uniref:SpaH/EbpB family LPXTG-anchored major pilin n=1 Tax=Clostridium yunnanense TaxID=2800325 RepID=A0ABS1EVN7_9CLOT|nr:SpaH/EbpB family LPXTG-anchored major pilin [Clostridium yunnanense]MBK1813437.1 SpaH/EbpB family LPXTG-anchored major pilin [Clostridium yunnanense]
MKVFKKLLGLIVPTLMLLATSAIPVHATTSETASTQCVPSGTSVTIHKIVGTQAFTLTDHNGGKLSADQISKLQPNGDAVENNTGVEFTAWKLKAPYAASDFADKPDSYVDNCSQYKVIVTAGQPRTFENGLYYVRETKHPATLVDASGVPFILELPALNVAGTGYLTELHIYPKNVIVNDTPTIDKDVETKGQDHASYDIGQSFNYLIYPKVPLGIQDYKAFKVEDTLSSTLDYLGNVVVTYNTEVLKPSDGYYTLTSSAENTAGGKLTVNFTTKGLQKLGTDLNGAKNLEIKFGARINNTALMGTNIYNNATLTYNNGYTGDKCTDVPNSNRPEVHTGGRQFVKVDNTTQTYISALSTASFVVKNTANKYMSKDSQGKINWKDDIKDATKINVNPNNGIFEVTGLAYGDNGAAVTYQLQEVDVPDKYVRMNDLSFTIDANSYGSKTNTSDNTKVINVKRPIIPQTGGIGTIIFLAAGLIIMGSSLVALKRKARA